MPITRLGLSATPRSPYGSFAGKTPESNLPIDFQNHQMLTVKTITTIFSVKNVLNIFSVKD